MKFVIVFVGVLVAGCTASPQYRFFQRQQQEDAPYPAAGFRPSGQQFYLPARQTQEEPRTIYGPPSTEDIPTTTDVTTEEPTTTLRPFGSQLNEARVPKPSDESTDSSDEDSQSDETTETTQDEATTTENPNEDDTEEEVEELDVRSVQQPPQATGQEGIYYVLLHNGQLQKVQYATTVNDVKNMAYSTQLNYENVQPISGPIYTFSPENQLYQVIF